MSFASGRSLFRPGVRAANPAGRWLPWWCRPSRMLMGASIPALIIFSFSDPIHTLSRAQHFYTPRDFVAGLAAMLALLAGALIGESGVLGQLWNRLNGRRQEDVISAPRLGETMLSPRFDIFLMAVFLVSHLIFFRGFITNPGLIAGVLGGNLELKHTFKTIPGVTTWTQVSLVLGAIRGMRWSGLLPGKIKLISVFHLLFFGTLFVRAILWSERLALIEGAVPFFVGALPRIAAAAGPALRTFLRFLPLLLPVGVFVLFVSFEFFRSWQYYSGQHSSIFEFGWRRLFTYYFEAMNTGAAIMQVSGFYDGLSGPVAHKTYEAFYEGLYLGTLDVEYNNPGGVHYLLGRTGLMMLVPFFVSIGIWHGLAWRAFQQGRLFALFFPITFLGLMEILRIPYWFGLNRVLPTTVVIVLILLWAATLRRRVRVPARATPGPESWGTPEPTR